MKDEIPKMTEVEQEERKTVFENLSREIGFLGVSLLHRLNALYGFDVLQDLVFDAMHLVSLNIVKRRVQYWLSNGILDKEEFGERLKRMPWSKGYKVSRIPNDITKMGFWKVEEYQKLAFPASEFVLEGLLPAEEYEVWAPISRIVELIFNCGRNGWTSETIAHLKALSWRHCILVEDRYGPSECVITLHSLTHLHEDISRFSLPDNFWCFQFEKAVERYVKQTSNRKGVEKTFARKEWRVPADLETW